jgi:crotonobetainyl-CoA:carnitine CoA-transferase CaiB-like acyl-CoA transferase
VTGLAWPALSAGQRPLAGLRVLDLTRILAGPVAGRCLAAYGAEVMLVNGPHLPNIEAIADTSRGKRSVLIDLREPAGRQQLDTLLASADVFLQGYRPGALAARGFGALAMAARRPGIVVASLSAYGDTGPWAGRRGFDSLVQTATGFNLAEAEAAGTGLPQAMPMQILDYAAGHLLAFGIQAALWRRATQGGSWQVQVSLAGVAGWLRGLGRVPGGLAAVRPGLEPFLEDSRCGFGAHGAGTLRAVRHAAQFSVTPAGFARPSVPPGSDDAAWSLPLPNG